MPALAVQLDYDASNLTTLVDRLERRGAVGLAPIRRSPGQGPRAHQRRRATTSELWHDLVEDPRPLVPLNKPDLQTLISLLNALNAESEHTVGAQDPPRRS